MNTRLLLAAKAVVGLLEYQSIHTRDELLTAIENLEVAVRLYPDEEFAGEKILKDIEKAAVFEDANTNEQIVLDLISHIAGLIKCPELHCFVRELVDILEVVAWGDHYKDDYEIKREFIGKLRAIIGHEMLLYYKQTYGGK